MKDWMMKICAVLAVLFAFAATPAYAQATRTWVSGVGDDANPCSRTAPCKTFAGAISKTAAGGEINCLDPAGYGALTITKSITVSCVGVTGGVLVSATNGFVINAAATDRVVIEGLDFEGLGTGLVGINILSARDVVVRNSSIRNFKAGNATGIQTNNTVSNVRLTVDNVQFFNNNYGIRLIGTVNGKALINNSAFVNNSVAAMGANGATNTVTLNGNSVTNSPKSVELLTGATGTTFGNNAFNSSPADPMTLTPLG